MSARPRGPVGSGGGADATPGAERVAAPAERSIRICFVAHSSRLAGAERILLELVTELITTRGIACSVVVPSDGVLVEKLRMAGAEVRKLELNWWCAFDEVPADEVGRRLYWNWKLLASELSALEELDPDVVVTCTLVHPWGALLAGLLGKPHVWYVMEFGETDHGLRFFLPFDRVRSFIKAASNTILTISDAVREELFPHLAPPRCETLYCGIPKPRREGAATDLFREETSFKVGVFGFLHPSKGQHTAVAAAGELTRRGRKVELLLAGEGNGAYLERLERMLEGGGLRDRVHLPGFVEEVYSAMDQVDAVLICSRHEAFGRVAVEGMLLGKPVVYPRSGGVAEVMASTEGGLAYAPGDVASLVEVLDRLIGDPDLAVRLGERGAQQARARFGMGAFVDGFLAAVEKLRAAAPAMAPDFASVIRAELETHHAEDASRSATVQKLRGDQEALQRELDSLALRRKELEDQLAASQEESRELRQRLGELESQAADAAARVRGMAQTQEQLESEVDRSAAEIAHLGALADSMRVRASQLEQLAVERQQELETIKRSLGGRLLLATWSLLVRLLPEDSWRGRLYRSIRGIDKGPERRAGS